jgi:DNA excision repair protein ERCC-2
LRGFGRLAKGSWTFFAGPLAAPVSWVIFWPSFSIVTSRPEPASFWPRSFVFCSPIALLTRERATRADPAARTLEIGVTELLLGPERQAAFSGGGAHAVWLGQVLHAEYQREAACADPAFEAEVPLREVLSHRGWTVTVRGRADGVRPLGSGWCLEELKLASDAGAGVVARGRLQAALYARMLERMRGGPVRAVLVRLGETPPLREELALDAGATERALRAALDATLDAAFARERAQAARRAAAPAVRFPHAALRAGQAEIQAHVAHALEEGEQLLLEAATGSGKTAAVLTPALRFALATGRRLVVLTASTLQQHLVAETLGRLAPGLVPLATRLRAKARMCTRGDLLCHEAVCASAARHAEQRDALGLVPRCFDAGGLALPDAVHALARDAGACPSELQREAADASPVVVCDLNYAIDPAVALPELRDPARLRETIFVIDEVHQVPERAREALSLPLSGPALRAAIEAAALGGGPLHRELRGAAEALRARLFECAREAGVAPGADWAPFEPPEDALAEASLALGAAVLGVARSLGGAPAGPLAPLFALAFALERFVAGRGAPGLVSLVGCEDGEVSLERHCVDPAPALGRLFGACHALVGCSATLFPPELHAASLGLAEERAVHRRIAPEDRGARRAVVIDGGVTSAEASRSRETPRIARRLAALAAAVPGNCLALFPSFGFLDAVRAALPASAGALRWQARGDGEAERSALLDELRRREDLLVLAVAGGALAEGVDYAGARLCAVAVVGPCLPAPSTRRALLAERLEQDFGRGFELAYAAPGMTRVVQSAGRLLRGDGDRGVIALYDRRFLREPYRSWLPAEWLGGRPPEALRGDPAAVARRFFAE